MVANTCQHHQNQLKSYREQVITPTQNLADTLPPNLLTIPATVLSTGANLQPQSSTVPRCYPLRTHHPPTKYNSYPYS